MYNWIPLLVPSFLQTVKVGVKNYNSAYLGAQDTIRHLFAVTIKTVLTRIQRCLHILHTCLLVHADSDPSENWTADLSESINPGGEGRLCTDRAPHMAVLDTKPNRLSCV